MLRLFTVSRLVRRTLCVRAEEMGKKGSFFYAVRKGHRPGVYQTWDECKFQVDRFPDARYKKFASEAEAWAFVQNKTTSTENSEAAQHTTSASVSSKRTIEEDEDNGQNVKRVKLETSEDDSTKGLTYMGDAVVVYTDGCCTKNGRDGARAGIGVYWGPNHPLNISERLSGRQTNQRAELRAACRALEQAIEMDIEKLVLYTDSKFTINGITSWVKNWKTNGWRLKTGGAVVNKDDFQKLDELNEELDVKWLHIPGHAGYLGNEEADRLSREGAAKPQW